MQSRDALHPVRSARQAHIFDAAMTLFEQRGYDAVTVEDICSAGEVGRATFFRLFGGKAGLIEEANRRTADQVRRRVAEAEARGAAALAAMGEVISAAWLTAGTPVYAMFEALMGGAPVVGSLRADAARDGSAALAALAVDYVIEGQADEEFRADLDPQAMGLSFMSLLVTACSIWVSHDHRDPQIFPRRVVQAVDVMIAGLRRSEGGHAV